MTDGMIFFKDKTSGMVYSYPISDVEKALNLTNETPDVFYDIADELKGMYELVGIELAEHLNPTPTTEQLARQVREKRDQLISELDAVVSNPLRFAELSDETKAELGAYRQLLLDVPQQNSFPTDIVWPETPSILNSGHITP